MTTNRPENDFGLSSDTNSGKRPTSLKKSNTSTRNVTNSFLANEQQGDGKKDAPNIIVLDHYDSGDQQDVTIVKPKRKKDADLDDVIVISSDDEQPTTTSTTTKTSPLEPTVGEVGETNAGPVVKKIEIYDSIDEFEQNLPETVTLISTPYGSKIYLVGTAHFSLKSQDDVSLVIRNVQPDIVMVELCQSRIHMLKHDEKTLLEEAKNVNFAKIQNIMKTNGTMHGIFYILLLKMSAEITSRLGMAPGGEFRRAMEEVHRIPNCVLHLGDRPINITLQRALNGLSVWEKVKLVWSLLTFNESISEEEVEECKKSDILEGLLEEMAEKYPAFGQVFVKERDMYMTHSLQVAAIPQPQPYHAAARPVVVVGVVGIGHVAGILNNWGKLDPMKIPQILLIPPPSRTGRVIKFTIKYAVLGGLAYGVFRFARPKLQNLLKL